MAHIGIKTADGKFYPITTDDGISKKLLRLVPAREHQTSVQVDLYRGNPDTMITDSEYIGSLLLERIEAEQDGGRRIELILQYDENHELSATATDLGSGSYQSFSVNLDALTENSDFDMPDFSADDEQTESVHVDSLSDFDMDEEEDLERELESGLDDIGEIGSTMPEPPSFDAQSHVTESMAPAVNEDFPEDYDTEDEPPVVRKFPLWFLAIIALVVIAAAGLIAFGIFLLLRGSATALLENSFQALLAWIPAIG